MSCRSLVEGTHYVGFWQTDRNDFRQVINNLRRPEKAVWLSQVAEEAQRFAWKYTSETARMLYWQRALTEYKTLFPDMDEYIGKLPA